MFLCSVLCGETCLKQTRREVMVCGVELGGGAHTDRRSPPDGDRPPHDSVATGGTTSGSGRRGGACHGDQTGASMVAGGETSTATAAAAVRMICC